MNSRQNPADAVDFESNTGVVTTYMEVQVEKSFKEDKQRDFEVVFRLERVNLVFVKQSFRSFKKSAVQNVKFLELLPSR